MPTTTKPIWEENEKNAAVRAAVVQLFCEAFDSNGVTVHEIAEALRCSASTVRKYLLKFDYENEGSEDEPEWKRYTVGEIDGIDRSRNNYRRGRYGRYTDLYRPTVELLTELLVQSGYFRSRTLFPLKDEP